MKFADLLRELRAKANLSQSGLARASGLSLGAIHDYEQGKRKPGLGSAAKLAKALGTTCEVLAECDDIAEETPAKGKRRGK